jgi:hypothetical protein
MSQMGHEGERRPPCAPRLLASARQKHTREEFVVDALVEPGALDVQQAQAWNQTVEGQRVDDQLGDRLVGARVGLVVRICRLPERTLQNVDVVPTRG